MCSYAALCTDHTLDYITYIWSHPIIFIPLTLTLLAFYYIIYPACIYANVFIFHSSHCAIRLITLRFKSFTCLWSIKKKKKMLCCILLCGPVSRFGYWQFCYPIYKTGKCWSKTVGLIFNVYNFDVSLSHFKIWNNFIFLKEDLAKILISKLHMFIFLDNILFSKLSISVYYIPIRIPHLPQYCYCQYIRFLHIFFRKMSIEFHKWLKMKHFTDTACG